VQQEWVFDSATDVWSLLSALFTLLKKVELLKVLYDILSFLPSR
jgi:hypothetical protein